MSQSQSCPECGAPWQGVQTCEDYFHQMLFWEAENPAYGAQSHHLMVLCYHLQHPSLYSPEGLEFAQQLLVEFLEHGRTPEQIRLRNRHHVDSSRRNWKITGAGEARGSYTHAMRWSMTAADVVAGGVEHYCDRVRSWALSIDIAKAAEK
jgi:Family of unknown function (DUF5946)